MSDDLNEPQLTVELQSLSRRLEHIKSYEIQSSYTQSTDSFSFEAYHEDRDLLFGLEMQPVELSINGASQVLGRIERTEAGAGLARRYSGRDYISDMVECHVDPTLKLKDGETVGGAITLAASVVGVDTVQSDSDVALRNIRTGKSIATSKPSPDFRETPLKEYKAVPGEGIFEFCNRIAARHHSTIQPGTTRSEVVLTSPNYDQESTFTLIRLIDGGGNIVHGSASRDYSAVPTMLFNQGKFGGSAEVRKTVIHQVSYDEYVRLPPAAITSRDPVAIEEKEVVIKPATPRASSSLNADNSTRFAEEIANTLVPNAVLTRTKPGVKNDPLRLYRFHYMKDEQSRTAEQLQSATKRRFAELFKDTLVYTCTVKGHRDPVTGAMWAVDTMCDVVDDVERVYQKMWIHSRTFRYDPSGGATTELELWLPNVFSL